MTTGVFPVNWKEDTCKDKLPKCETVSASQQLKVKLVACRLLEQDRTQG